MQTNETFHLLFSGLVFFPPPFGCQMTIILQFNVKTSEISFTILPSHFCSFNLEIVLSLQINRFRPCTARKLSFKISLAYQQLNITNEMLKFIWRIYTYYVK